MSATEFVSGKFDVPTELVGVDFRLTPLLPEHNDSDYDAWTSSMDHIQATPGFEDWGWPKPMTKEENLRDLERHSNDFRERVGFTYTVLDPSGATIGCVYIYPAETDADADAHSWVRADHAHLDIPLYDAVSEWLRQDWPFEAVDYANRSASA